MVWHALGFHGSHWGPTHWYLGNIWVTCQKCGKSRQIGPEEAMPAGEIQGNPDDGLAEWRRRNGIIVGGQMKHALREYGLSLWLLAVAGIVIASLVSSCTPAQQAQADLTLQTACSDAMAIANIAGLVPGVGAILPYINVGCATAEGLAKLASDPSSAEWLGTLVGQIRTLAGNAGLRLP